MPSRRSCTALGLIALARLLVTSSQPRATAGDVLPFKATERTLQNGLNVIIVPTDQQLGYALDSEWCGIGEFTSSMRKALQALKLNIPADKVTITPIAGVFAVRP